MKNVYIFLFFYIIGPIHFEAQNVIVENQPIADAGNGTYINPIIPGRYANPSIVKLNSDYYMVHSMTELIWHSKDLVNWAPLSYATKSHAFRSYAPEIVHVNNKFYIYTTFKKSDEEGDFYFENVVLISENAEGPWSDPINLNIPGKIDPGHISTEDGKRYLYFNNGEVIELDSSGTKTIGLLKKVYDGWEYPEEWVVECFCLESPKLFKRGDYFYLVSAQGGTAGPPTSHMSIVARSSSPLGPWENSPHNPLIRTKSDSDKWWSQGHATLIEGPQEKWYAIFHAYENENRHLGRQTLLMPIQWSDDGWPVNQNMDNAEGYYPIPENGKGTLHGMSLSDGFESETLGMQWRWYNNNSESSPIFKSGNKKLLITAIGNSMEDGSLLGFLPVNSNYEISVKILLESNAHGGIILMPSAFNVDKVTKDGIGLSPDGIQVNSGLNQLNFENNHENSLYLKIRNLKNTVSMYYSKSGHGWTKLETSSDISNVKSLVAMLYSYGKGKVVFEDLKYIGL